MQELPNHAFWQFSLRVYALDPVKDALLFLQNQHNLNINLILYGCWLAKLKCGRLQRREIQQLINNSEYWQQRITKPLRKIRRTAKHSDIYNDLLAAELDAEHIEQLLLAETLLKTPSKKRTDLQCMQDNMHSIVNYASLREARFNESSAQQMCHMLKAIFPELALDAIEKAFQKALRKRSNFGNQGVLEI